MKFVFSLTVFVLLICLLSVLPILDLVLHLISHAYSQLEDTHL